MMALADRLQRLGREVAAEQDQVLAQDLSLGSVRARVIGQPVRRASRGRVWASAAVLVAAAIIGVNTMFSNVLEPRLMGRSFGISPWMVFVALLFWAYVLGPVGMILAIPLTVALKLGLEMSDRTKWLAALMA